MKLSLGELKNQWKLDLCHDQFLKVFFPFQQLVVVAEQHWNSFHQAVEEELVLHHAPKVVGEHQEVLALVEEVVEHLEEV